MFQYAALGLALAGVAQAHVAAFVKGMYCGNGTSNDNVPNTNTAVNPLFQLSQSDWWFQHYSGCDTFPPFPGDFVELPAGGSFTVELAHNKGQTTLAGDGATVTDWPDGKEHPDDWNDPNCIQDDGALHTTGEQGAAGTAWAISYNSDIADVTLDNLVVFTTLDHTPWKRLATYDVPADLPACPDDGCTCAWLWVPNGCGEPNMYMAGYKCKVTGSTSNRQLAAPQVPTYCGDGSACTTGAKQMIAWHQESGNNVQVPDSVNPMYNAEMGFQNGAQNDIFA